MIRTKYELEILKTLHDKNIDGILTSVTSTTVANMIASKDCRNTRSKCVVAKSFRNLTDKGLIARGPDDWRASTYYITSDGKSLVQGLLVK